MQTAAANLNRPAWLPEHLPELDGLRGLAILAVLFFHNSQRLSGTCLVTPASFGWSGVELFFVLSGFLITSVLLRAQPQHYFRNFYARRALRIWPLYYLLLALCYGTSGWLLSRSAADHYSWFAIATQLLFLQNLVHIPLTGSLVPTWSLAIEEQYYLAWAPIVRFLRRPWQMAVILIATLAAMPWMRLHLGNSLAPLNTLVHLDSIAFGSLLALGLFSLRTPRRIWIALGIAATLIGFVVSYFFAVGTVYYGTTLGLGFAGVVLTAITATGARNPLFALLRRGPLPFYGRISYGLYLCHIPLFIWMGGIDGRLDALAAGRSHSVQLATNLAVFAIRIAAATALATLLWHGLEKQILKLKKYFPSR